jgi:hypothetical protein
MMSHDVFGRGFGFNNYRCNMDLMDMFKGAVNDQVLKQIGGALGTDAQSASKAVGTAVPAILGGLLKQSSTPEGASKVFGMLDKVDSGMLGNLTDALSGGKAQSMIELGTKLLPMIFGQNYSSITNVLGKVTGLGAGKLGPLLGMLAPIVIGLLSKHAKATGMNAASFGQFMMDQKKSLSGLDPSLSESLEINNLLGSGRQMVESASRSVQSGMDTARSAAATATSVGSSIGRWIILLLSLVAIGIAIWYFVNRKDAGFEGTKNLVPSAGPKTETDEPSMSPRQPRKDSPEKTETKADDEPPADAGSGVAAFLADASKLLTDIKDDAGAKSAAEAFQGLAGKVDGLGLDKLSGLAKTAASTGIKKFLDEVKSWAEKAYGVTGVREVLEPAVNGLVDKLKGFAE